MRRLILPALAGALLLTTPVHAQPLQEWDFTGPASGAAGEHGCTTRVEDGQLRGQINEGAWSMFMFLPEIDVPAPVRLRMRVRTSEEVFGRGELYWITHEDARYAMDKMIQFPMVHDGAFHEYDIALPTRGRLRQLRLALGSRGGDFAVDWIRLEQDTLPGHVTGAMLPEQLTIEDEHLRAVFLPREQRYVIEVKGNQRVYEADARLANYHVFEAKVVSEIRMELGLYDQMSQTSYRGVVELTEPGVISFELDCAPYTPREAEIPSYRKGIAAEEVGVGGPPLNEKAQPFFALSEWPPRLTTDTEDGRIFFNDRSAGTLITQDDTTFGGSVVRVYGNTTCTDLPLMGLVDLVHNDGYIALVETPYDAFFSFSPDGAGKHWPQVHWMESLDGFRYPRRFSYRFVVQGGYVALAQRYRAYAEQQGLVFTLRDKAVSAKPEVAKMAGAPIIWGSLDAYEFVQQARALGLLRGVICNPSHGIRDRDNIRKLNDMGYITAPYDSFADYRSGPLGHHSAPSAEYGLHRRPGAGPAAGWEDPIHTFFTASAVTHLPVLQMYLDEDIAQNGYNGRFIDVSMAWTPDEDWHPKHSYDTRADIGMRNACFKYIADRGAPLGIEHGNDWGIDLIEWTEGAIGGPFFWEPSPGIWNPGYLQPAESKDDYTEKWLKYGNGFDTRIPFWQLVYGDCNVSTWYWGDSAGMHYHADPSVAARKDLFTLLYGGTPLLWRDRTGFDFIDHRDRFMETVYTTVPFQEEVFYARMLSHVWLTKDMAVQQTLFDTGHTVTVNFSDKVYVMESGVMLPPEGYYVRGPGYTQERVMDKGEVVTRLEKDGFRRYDTASERVSNGVRVKGHFVAFRVNENRWQFALHPASYGEFLVSELTGWDMTEPVTLVELDDHNEMVRVVDSQEAAGPRRLEAEATPRFFALLRDAELAAGDIVAYPADEWLADGAALELSTPGPGATIRYTLDGTTPAVDSPAYTEPLKLDKSAVLKARVFVNRYAFPKVLTKACRVATTLFDTPEVVRGGDPTMHIDVPTGNAAELRLFIDDGQDNPWSDWANWADAAFVMPDGSRKHLSDMDPVRNIFSNAPMKPVGGDGDAQGLMVNGVEYERGLACNSVMDLTYAVPEGAARFEAWAGLDDRANPKPGEPEVLRGSVTFTVQAIAPWQAGPPRRIRLTPVQVEGGMEKDTNLAEGQYQEFPAIRFDMQAPWMTAGSVHLRFPEVLRSSLGCHFVEGRWGGENSLEPLHYMDAYPMWKTNPRTGAISYNKRLPEGVEFGATITPGFDVVDLEFRFANRAPSTVSFASADMCLNFLDADDFNGQWPIDRIYLAVDGELMPLSEATPTPEDMGRSAAWFGFVAEQTLKTFQMPRDPGMMWFADQVADELNLMAVASKDGRRLVGYTWDRQPPNNMSNCGYPCLHTGAAPTGQIGPGETHTWRGRVYFVENDPRALIERVRTDRERWE